METTATELEVLPASSVEALQRGEIDIQISTAHRFPRSIAAFKKRALDMALLDDETASSCLYSRPVGTKNGKQQFAEGLSIRMAEIVGASYGNLRVGAQLIEVTPRYVKARGFAHDLESNFASASEVIEATVKKDGTPYDERMRVVIAKAALAKARRDATFQVVPRALCKPIETEARRVAVGDASTLAQRRTGVLQWIGKLGIEIERVFRALGIEGEEDIGVAELTTLTGIKTAIRDGEVTVDEAFPDKPTEEKPPVQAEKPDFAGKAAPANKRGKGGEKGNPAAGNRLETAAPAETPAPESAPLRDSSAQEPGKSAPPPFTADTPQDKLAIDLNDADIDQKWFVTGLRMLNPTKVARQAVTVHDLSDEAVSVVYEEGIDAIRTLIESYERNTKKGGN